MEPGKAVATGRLQNIRRVLARGIVLFGYDTGIACWCGLAAVLPLALRPARREWLAISSKTNTISSNVVSVLQAGAFFGAHLRHIGHRAQTHPSALHTHPRHSPPRSTGFALIYAGCVVGGIVGSVARVPVGVQSQEDNGLFQITVCFSLFLRVAFLFLYPSFLSPSVLFPSFLHLSSLTESYSIRAYLNAKLAGPKAVGQIPFGFQLVMLLGLFTVKP
ncbi:hypothetical protein B0H13DRAFT_2374838 [Mycena leptocephala]|nr:hypothetical protein B0H13DRAFT_2374838 [Mycena leptocephala]